MEISRRNKIVTGGLGDRPRLDPGIVDALNYCCGVHGIHPQVFFTEALRIATSDPAVLQRIREAARADMEQKRRERLAARTLYRHRTLL